MEESTLTNMRDISQDKSSVCPQFPSSKKKTNVQFKFPQCCCVQVIQSASMLVGVKQTYHERFAFKPALSGG